MIPGFSKASIFRGYYSFLYGQNRLHATFASEQSLSMKMMELMFCFLCQESRCLAQLALQRQQFPCILLRKFKPKMIPFVLIHSAFLFSSESLVLFRPEKKYYCRRILSNIFLDLFAFSDLIFKLLTDAKCCVSSLCLLRTVTASLCASLHLNMRTILSS